jgi:ABC-type oligopeptide transport system substrate-binding subunit
MLDKQRKPGEFDVSFTPWFPDYPDPSGVLNVLLSPWAANDPVYQHKLDDAQQLTGSARYRTYGRLDAEIARNASPFVAFANGVTRDFFSARIGCQLYQPVYGIDLAALCLRK